MTKTKAAAKPVLTDAEKLQERLARYNKQAADFKAKAKKIESDINAKERKRQNNQKYIIGGAIIGSLKELNDTDKQIIISLLNDKLKADDKLKLKDLIDFDAQECKALDYL